LNSDEQPTAGSKNAIVHALEVIGHLLWCYAVMIGVFLVGATMIFLVFSGGKVGLVRDFIESFLTRPAFVFGMLHVIILTSFRFYFLPRFPGASPTTMFAIVAVFGTLALSVIWSLDTFRDAVPSGNVEAFFNWLRAHAEEPLSRLLISAGITLGAGGFGLVMEQFGGQQRLMWGIGRWIGWLIVGRKTYEDFLVREKARLQRDYDAYVEELRRKK
jgi:hypothetical protein